MLYVTMIQLDSGITRPICEIHSSYTQYTFNIKPHLNYEVEKHYKIFEQNLSCILLDSDEPRVLHVCCHSIKISTLIISFPYTLLVRGNENKSSSSSLETDRLFIWFQNNEPQWSASWVERLMIWRCFSANSAVALWPKNKHEWNDEYDMMCIRMNVHVQLWDTPSSCS